MAADEPPYLTIGTDVSAKYKGAFCEAKIKKVNRVVKCKVTFKNNLGSAMIPDDHIKGPLRIGADVEAKHLEKNQFFEAVINKIHDYSQYTVVFNDGDETTLKRTSLCLKSGRHFAESPTLDQFPLTHPEHFGAPVIGDIKPKRKRRATLNSSFLDADNSDDDVIVKRVKKSHSKERDSDLGKVVCVECGDRRKKDNWYPGLIVPPPKNSSTKIAKDEYFIRSFQDGKYYQVRKKDTTEFSKEVMSKVEGNKTTLRTAVEKALLYYEKEELPPHWDKALFTDLQLPSTDEACHDSDSDTDDEPSEEKDRFVAQLYKFMDERGTPMNKAPTVAGKDLNLYKLFKVVQKIGGYNKVTNQNKWRFVYSKMALPSMNTNGSSQIKMAYKRYLHSFEDFYRKLGCTMVTDSRTTRGRHRSDRNIITRNKDRDAASPKSRSGKEIKDKGKRRGLKSDDKEDKEFLCDSEEGDNKSLDHDLGKDSEKEEPRHSEIEVGDIVKVKYGRAIYKANVLKIEPDGTDKRFFVHYAGWNKRYDEWVSRNYIVANVSESKEQKRKEQKKKKEMKKAEQDQLFESFSDTKQHDESAASVSFPKEKPLDDDDNADTETGDKFFDNEENFKLEDMSVKSETCSGSENITEPESAVSTTECKINREDFPLKCKSKCTSGIKEDLPMPKDIKKESTESESMEEIPEKQNEIEMHDKVCVENVVKADDVIEGTVTATSEDNTSCKEISRPETDNDNSLTASDISCKSQTEENKNSLTDDAIKLVPENIFIPISPKRSEMHFSDNEEGLDTHKLNTPANFDVSVKHEPSELDKHDSSSKSSDLTDTSQATGDSVTAVQTCESNKTVVHASFSLEDSLEKEVFPDSSSKHETVIKRSSKEENVESNTTILCEPNTGKENSGEEKEGSQKEASVFTPSVCHNVPVIKEIGTSEEKVESKSAFQFNQSENNPDKDKSLTSDVKNIFPLSFSSEQESCDANSLPSGIHHGLSPKPSEIVDLSKTIPSILERLKKDVADTKIADSPPLCKELSFDFLCGSQEPLKSLSRSDSSNSLRICEDMSDTNDSNNDPYAMALNTTVSFSERKVEESKTSDAVANNYRCLNMQVASHAPLVSSLPTMPSTLFPSEKYTGPCDILSDTSVKDISLKPQSPGTKFDILVSSVTTSESKNIDKTSTNSTPIPVDTISIKDISESSNIKRSDQSSNNPVSKDSDSLFDDLLKTSRTATTYVQDSVSSDSKPFATKIAESINTIKDEVQNQKSEDILKLSVTDDSSKISCEENVTSETFPQTPADDNLSDDCKSPDLLSNNEMKIEDDGYEDESSIAMPRKEGKRKKKLKRFGTLDPFDKEESKEGKEKIKEGKSKFKKCMIEMSDFEKEKDYIMKSKMKKMKKNKNKKRFSKDDDINIVQKIKKKEKRRRNDKKFLKSGFGAIDFKSELIKKKKEKKTRDKLSMSDRKDLLEKKIKKRKKDIYSHVSESNEETPELPLKTLDKKKKERRKFSHLHKSKDYLSSDDGADKFFKPDKNLSASSTMVAKQDLKNDDVDMSFLLCEEKVPASPIERDAHNLLDDTSGGSSMDESISKSTVETTKTLSSYGHAKNETRKDNLKTCDDLMNAISSSYMHTVPSSSNSPLLSSSPCHESNTFSNNYRESTPTIQQSERKFGDHENKTFLSSPNSNLKSERDDDSADFVIGDSKELTHSFHKQQWNEMQGSSTKRKRRSRIMRQNSDSSKSPKYKSYFSYAPKVDYFDEEEKKFCLSSPTASTFSRCSYSMSPAASESAARNPYYIEIKEEDREKRVAFLEGILNGLRKRYMFLKENVTAIDRKHNKMKRKAKAAAAKENANPNNTSSEDGPST